MPPKKKQDKDDENERLDRIAIVEAERCRPKKCKQECKKQCPVVKIGKHCVEVTEKSKIANIDELLCIGCGICVKKCPFEAIHYNYRRAEKETTHGTGRTRLNCIDCRRRNLVKCWVWSAPMGLASPPLLKFWPGS